MLLFLELLVSCQRASALDALLLQLLLCLVAGAETAPGARLRLQLLLPRDAPHSGAVQAEAEVEVCALTATLRIRLMRMARTAVQPHYFAIETQAATIVTVAMALMVIMLQRMAAT